MTVPARKEDKREVKATAFKMDPFQSEKGRVMIENQRDSRRQRHIAALQDCEKFVESFYESFLERKRELKEKVTTFLEASDKEIEKIMATLTDDNMLDNEIGFVNGAWDKVQQHRTARKE